MASLYPIRCFSCNRANLPFEAFKRRMAASETTGETEFAILNDLVGPGTRRMCCRGMLQTCVESPDKTLAQLNLIFAHNGNYLPADVVVMQRRPGNPVVISHIE